MTKIEAYREAQNTLSLMKDFVETRGNPSCDKKGCKVTIKDDYLGLYGCSSTSSWGTAVRKELEWQMEHNIGTLALQAIDRLTAQAEEKRLEAKEEAEEILKATTN